MLADIKGLFYIWIFFGGGNSLSLDSVSANLGHHWSNKCSFLCVQTNWVCRSGTPTFCKKWLWLESRVIDCDSSRVILWKTWLESSHFVKNVTRVESFCEKRDSSRVTIFLNVTRVESESPKIAIRVESLTRVMLSLQVPTTNYGAGISITTETYWTYS